MSQTKPNVMVDIVSERNETLGVDYRNNLLTEGKNFRTVHILLCDRHGRIALQVLPNDHNRSPNKMGSSVAGYLLANETYYAAAKRKMREELGIENNLTEVGVLDMVDENSHKFVMLYKSTFTGRIKDFNREEISKIVYRSTFWISVNIYLFPNRFTPTFIQVFSLYQLHA